MSSATDKHGQDHLELVCLYALEALPSSEALALEAHISACAHCQRELETLRPIVESFVSWPTDVLRPPTSLRGRLAQRIAADTGVEPVLVQSQATWILSFVSSASPWSKRLMGGSSHDVDV